MASLATEIRKAEKNLSWATGKGCHRWKQQREHESRRDWILDRFTFRAANDSKRKYYPFRQDGQHEVELLSIDFIDQKLHYIHQNPVRNLLVGEPEHYLFSSAANYAGQKGLLEVLLLE